MLERQTRTDECLAQMDQRLSTLEGELTAVRAELRPNGGSSVRDALDRVDRRTAQLAPRRRRRWRRG
jgi:hypothetical protein